MRPTMLRKLRAPTPAPFGVCRNSCTLTSAPAASSDSLIQRSARALPWPPWLRGPIAHSSTRRRYALSSSNRGGFVGGATSRAARPAARPVHGDEDDVAPPLRVRLANALLALRVGQAREDVEAFEDRGESLV